MRIGITEYGDAGRDLSWTKKIDTTNGTVLITKSITEAFKEAVSNTAVPIILHCTCTGMGGTKMESGVPTPDIQLAQLKDMIDRNIIKKENTVIRIDPIYPSPMGIKLAEDVIKMVLSIFGEDIRIRISLMDMYPHARKKLTDAGFSVSKSYGNNFYATKTAMKDTADMLNRYPFCYELCAEDEFYHMLRSASTNGCISERDCALMGIEIPAGMTLNGQNRHGCHCLACKFELLRPEPSEHCKVRACPNGCLYCFWRRP